MCDRADVGVVGEESDGHATPPNVGLGLAEVDGDRAAVWGPGDVCAAQQGVPLALEGDLARSEEKAVIMAAASMMTRVEEVRPRARTMALRTGVVMGTRTRAGPWVALSRRRQPSSILRSRGCLKAMISPSKSTQ